MGGLRPYPRPYPARTPPVPHLTAGTAPLPGVPERPEEPAVARRAVRSGAAAGGSARTGAGRALRARSLVCAAHT